MKEVQGKKNRSESDGRRKSATETIISVRRSGAVLQIELPSETTALETVTINGTSFYREGTVKEKVRVAPMKFTDDHFEAVDELVQNGLSTKGACESVAEQHGFNIESFRQQYYRRHGSKLKVKT
jgi:hypothetical protein